jgi:superfamily II DNA or RNA helicase
MSKKTATQNFHCNALFALCRLSVAHGKILGAMSVDTDPVSPETVFGRHNPRSLTALLSNWADRITSERGIRYARAGAVQITETKWSDDRTFAIKGDVHGSDDAPYRTSVILYPAEDDWGEIEGECSCPVKWDCKHAVALIWKWADTAGVLQSAAAGVQVGVESPKEPEPTRVMRKRFLASPVDEWLQQTMNRADSATPAHAPRPSASPSTDRLVYTLSPMGILAAAKVRGAHYSDYKRSSSQASLAWVRHDHKVPAYVSPHDEPILRLMEGAQHRSQFAPEVRLVGQTGYQLLRMALAAERLHFLIPGNKFALSAPLTLAAPVRGALSWQSVVIDGAQGLRLAFTPEGSAVSLPLLSTQPPLAMDPSSASVMPIEVALSANSIERLLALPLLAPNDTTAWRFVRDAWSHFADAQHVPSLPFSIEPLPQPFGVLRFALVEINISHGWGKHQKESNVIVPAVEFTLQYADGRRVVAQPNETNAPIEEEVQEDRVVSQFVRNPRAERTWALRLPPRLMPLHEVEPALRYAMNNAQRQSLYALPRHAWNTDGPRVLADAQAAGFRMEIEPGFPLTLEDIPEPTLELVPTAQNGWYRFALGVDVGGVRVDLAPAFARVIAAQRDPQAWVESLVEGEKILLSLDDGRVVRLDGGRVRAMLTPVLAWFQGGALDEISVLQAALLPAQVVYRGRDNDTWLAMREKLKAGAKVEPVLPTAQFKADLRPYQLSGLAWLHHLHDLKMGAVLADDMGLGKTVQTLAHLDRVRAQRMREAPSLIVAPTSLISNWKAEANRFAPKLKVHVHHGKDRTLTNKEWRAADVVITSYPILQRDATTFSELEWDAIVFDEAQTLKNPRAKTYHAAQSLNARQRLALTGTPMENHLGELWSLFNLLSPGLLGDLETFNRHFRHRIEQNSDGDRMNILRARVRPFLLRRTRDEVVKELPEKTEAIRWIDLEQAQADLYETLRTAIHDDVRKAIDRKGLKQSTIHILDALLKLRQACCDPQLVRLPDGNGRADLSSAKMEWLLEHVPMLVEEGRRILIFSQFTSMLAIIEAKLTEAGIKTVILTGDTTDRDTPIAEFQKGEVPVFLLSLKAGGVGLNLTAADTVIHYDPWWNPAVETQATARAHRIGQDKPVFVYKLIARGTLEEKMLSLIERKQQLAQALLSGGSAALTGITAKDVDDLLAPIESIAALADREK